MHREILVLQLLTARVGNAIFFTVMVLKELFLIDRSLKHIGEHYYSVILKASTKNCLYIHEEDIEKLSKRYEELKLILYSVFDILDKLSEKYPAIEWLISLEKELLTRRVEDNLFTNSPVDALKQEYKWLTDVKKMKRLFYKENCDGNSQVH